jgi:hypothetical protein
VDDHQDETRAGQVVQPGELADRLSQRWTRSPGMINLRQPHERYASTAGWVAQRFPLLDSLNARYGVADQRRLGGQELVFGQRLTEKIGGPSYSSPSFSPPANSSPSFSPSTSRWSDSGMRTEPSTNSTVGNLFSGKVRISRKAAPLPLKQEKNAPAKLSDNKRQPEPSSFNPGLAASHTISSADVSAKSPADLQKTSGDSLNVTGADSLNAASADSLDKPGSNPLHSEMPDRSNRAPRIESSLPASDSIARQASTSPPPLTLPKKTGERAKSEARQKATGRASENTESRIVTPESPGANSSGAPAPASESEPGVPPVKAMRLGGKEPETPIMRLVRKPPSAVANAPASVQMPSRQSQQTSDHQVANLPGSTQMPDREFNSPRAEQLVLRKPSTDKSDESHESEESPQPLTTPLHSASRVDGLESRQPPSSPVTPQGPAEYEAQSRFTSSSTGSEGTNTYRSNVEGTRPLPLVKHQSPPTVIQRKSPGEQSIHSEQSNSLPSYREPLNAAPSQPSRSGLLQSSRADAGLGPARIARSVIESLAVNPSRQGSTLPLSNHFATAGPSRYEQWLDTQAQTPSASPDGAQSVRPIAVKEIHDHPASPLKPSFVWRKSAGQSAAAESLSGFSGRAPAIARQVNSSAESMPSVSNQIVAPPPTTEDERSGGIDVGGIIQEVIRVISRNLEVERERRGFAR